MTGTTPPTLGDLPTVDDKAAIWAFAMSFNGYDEFGSFEASAAAARQRSRDSIVTLRNELFVAARASRHAGNELFVRRYEELLPIFRGYWPLESKGSVGQKRPNKNGRFQVGLVMSSKALPSVQTFLAVYDYGQGGIWLLLDAASIEDARARFPRITIFGERPAWMSEAQERQFRSQCDETGFHWDVRLPPTGWLLSFDKCEDSR